MFWRCVVVLLAVWVFVWWLSVSGIEPPKKPVKIHLYHRPSVPVYPQEQGYWEKVSDITEI